MEISVRQSKMLIILTAQSDFPWFLRVGACDSASFCPMLPTRMWVHGIEFIIGGPGAAVPRRDEAEGVFNYVIEAFS
jgi:hypothetical protein